MKVLVTGAAGFIGSHVCDALAGAGHDVTGLDDCSTGSPGNLDAAIPLFQEDIRSARLTDIVEDVAPEAVFHLAAHISVRNSVVDPAHDADVNIMGTLNLLEAVQRHGVRRLVFSSTGGAIYGEQEEFPATEAHPTHPLSPYGVSKLACEKYLDAIRLDSGLSAIALRYSNVYGPRQDPFGEGGVVAIFAQRYLAGDAPVINGDGDQTRDFVYVKDVAQANLRALTSDAVGEVNIATGVETSVNALSLAIRDLTGSSVTPAHGDPKRGEQRRSVLSPLLAETRLGWTPETTLEQGLRETLQYFREQMQ